LRNIIIGRLPIYGFKEWVSLFDPQLFNLKPKPEIQSNAHPTMETEGVLKKRTPCNHEITPTGNVPNSYNKECSEPKVNIL